MGADSIPLFLMKKEKEAGGVQGTQLRGQKGYTHVELAALLAIFVLVAVAALPLIFRQVAVTWREEDHRQMQSAVALARRGENLGILTVDGEALFLEEILEAWPWGAEGRARLLLSREGTLIPPERLGEGHPWDCLPEGAYRLKAQADTQVCQVCQGILGSGQGHHRGWVIVLTLTRGEDQSIAIAVSQEPWTDH